MQAHLSSLEESLNILNSDWIIGDIAGAEAQFGHSVSMPVLGFLDVAHRQGLGPSIHGLHVSACHACRL